MQKGPGYAVGPSKLAQKGGRDIGYPQTNDERLGG